jgi:hypothetical protein
MNKYSIRYHPKDEQRLKDTFTRLGITGDFRTFSGDDATVNFDSLTDGQLREIESVCSEPGSGYELSGWTRRTQGTWSLQVPVSRVS